MSDTVCVTMVLSIVYNQARKRARPLDKQWTFGRQNPSAGYMHLAGVPVHRIVCTAFHNSPPTDQHVVDHIDTNRANNRAENLRWVSRLENVLLELDFLSAPY